MPRLRPFGHGGTRALTAAGSSCVSHLPSFVHPFLNRRQHQCAVLTRAVDFGTIVDMATRTIPTNPMLSQLVVRVAACARCPFSVYEDPGNTHGQCQMTQWREIDGIDDDRERPYWCPLRSHDAIVVEEQA
jgi:hypothetical protein